jgi:uncharacterized SAM-binding protein YcdF (DUF218 family)
MKHYDAIVILGSEPDSKTWEFPEHVYKSLDKALELIKQEKANYIALSGEVSLFYANTGIKQPFRECDRMEEYLISHGCPQEIILKEGKSRDTISNLYYLKNLVFKKHNFKTPLLITADFRAKRIRFLWQKIMGEEYNLCIETVATTHKKTQQKYEDFNFKTQKYWLENFADGDDAWLTGRFYKDPFYLSVEKRHQKESAHL